VNEDPTEKLIKDLKEENERLKSQLSGGKIDINEIKAMSGNENLSKEGNPIFKSCLAFEIFPIYFSASFENFIRF
jgi:hypothetical protein